ncbi:hypothetical protein WN48_10793 [Eufriesea mexicana]|uniref:Uncharacterized protein n=1 Tax=Eufriesea mexicana TaxID=516756 RepID=A0A310SUE7_9HYME|nr:hypothetical protein WN48_10793 [Eufriesea mexicana]
MSLGEIGRVENRGVGRVGVSGSGDRLGVGVAEKDRLEEETRRIDKNKERARGKKGRGRWLVGGSDKKFIRRSVGAGGVAIMGKNGGEKGRRRRIGGDTGVERGRVAVLLAWYRFPKIILWKTIPITRSHHEEVATHRDPTCALVAQPAGATCIKDGTSPSASMCPSPSRVRLRQRTAPSRSEDALIRGGHPGTRCMTRLTVTGNECRRRVTLCPSSCRPMPQSRTTRVLDPASTPEETMTQGPPWNSMHDEIDSGFK